MTDERQNAKKSSMTASKSKSQIDPKYLQNTNFRMDGQSALNSQTPSFLNAMDGNKSAENGVSPLMSPRTVIIKNSQKKAVKK